MACGPELIFTSCRTPVSDGNRVSSSTFAVHFDSPVSWSWKTLQYTTSIWPCFYEKGDWKSSANITLQI